VYLQGVMAAAPLAFVIPPLCVMKLRPEPIFSKGNIVPILIATFGALVAVVGFIMAVINFSEGIQCSHGKDMGYCIKEDILIKNVTETANMLTSAPL
jgi:sodium-coupled neutral amino acid transporter 11